MTVYVKRQLISTDPEYFQMLQVKVLTVIDLHRMHLEISIVDEAKQQSIRMDFEFNSGIIPIYQRLPKSIPRW
jgi:hypothetical protein